MWESNSAGTEHLVWKQGAPSRGEHTGETARSSQHDVSCTVEPAQDNSSSHPIPDELIVSKGGRHPFDFCKLTFTTRTQTHLTHTPLCSKVQVLPHHVGSRALLQWVSWAEGAAGQAVGRRQTCHPKQVSPLPFVAWERAVWRHSTQHKWVGNLSFKWPGNESLE